MKRTLHLTESQAVMLLALAEGVCEIMEDSTSDDDVDIRAVQGLPRTSAQLGRLGRVWYKLRRMRWWSET